MSDYEQLAKKQSIVISTYQQKLADADLQTASALADLQVLRQEHEQVLEQLARLQRATEDPQPDEPEPVKKATGRPKA